MVLSGMSELDVRFVRVMLCAAQQEQKLQGIVVGVWLEDILGARTDC